jgi:hypothetical protein
MAEYRKPAKLAETSSIQSSEANARCWLLGAASHGTGMNERVELIYVHLLWTDAVKTIEAGRDGELNPIQKDLHDALVEVLGKRMLWEGLGEKDLESLVTLCKEPSFEAGDKIVRKGDKGVNFYLILEGSVEVKSDSVTLAKFGTGQFFGEMSLLDDEPRSADVIAVEPTRCLVLNAQELNTIVESNPKIAMAMLREVSRRLRATTKSVRE